MNLLAEYPHPYDLLVWDYGKANCQSVEQALEEVNWQYIFKNSEVNKQVNILNSTLMNIFFKF